MKQIEGKGMKWKGNEAIKHNIGQSYARQSETRTNDTKMTKCLN
jgi:hypothetical protein